MIFNRASLLPLLTAALYVPAYYLWTGNGGVALLLCLLPLTMLFTHRKNLFTHLPETPFRTMVFHHNLDECIERKGPEERS